MTHARPQRLLGIVSVFVLSALLAVTYFANDVPLRLSEKACRLRFEEAQTKASLALENTSGRMIAAHIKLELLNPQNQVRYRIARDEPINPGSATLHFALQEVANKVPASHSDKLWYRLHYVITPLNIAAADAALQPLEGFISASEITPDIFELQVFAPDEAKAGTRYQARVRTAHPITGQGVSSVAITAIAKVEIDDKEQALKAAGMTNEDGYAIVNFDLPKDTGADSSQLEIAFTAKRGSLEQQAEADITLLQIDHYIVTTDKTLYQPGQTMHTRVLLFDANRQAKRAYEMDVVIEDAEAQKIFRTKIKTSNFGVASFDWKIPDNVRLGNYRVIVDRQSSRRLAGQATVKISRYDLPTFTVQAEPDHEYYLPGQNAQLVVKADYLFGQPVTKGKVKVIRESERRWNYREQKYDTEEGETYEGETDATGKFTAQIKLDEHQADFNENTHRKYEDLHFVAYFTDATTRRTEQRRFDLRLTKQPIHLYLINDANQTVHSPLEFNVSASYADGTPAPCEITLQQRFSNDEEKLLRTIKTNRYGVAKVSALMVAEDDLKLVLLARDAAGKTGELEQSIHRSGEPNIRIATDKALYRFGDPIKATLKSNLLSSRIVFEVLQDNRVLHSQMLELRAGQATITLPHRPEFKDEVTLVAYTNVLVNEHDDKFVYGSRTVLYPRDRELKLDVKLPRTDYQPGEEVTAALSVRTPDGRGAFSALGAVVVDTAVEARARTDNDFGGNNYRSYYNYFYGSESLSGLTRRDLDKLDLKQPIPAELDLVAEILLRDYGSRLRNHHDSDYQKDQRYVFSQAIEAQLKPLKHWLENEYNTKAVYPKDIATLKRILRASEIDPETLLDPWGTAYRFSFVTERDKDEMGLLSAGADKTFATPDDFTVLNIARLYFKFTGEAINRAVANHQARTGDYIRNADMLKAELKRTGIDFDALRDAWDTPFEITFCKDWHSFRLSVTSAGRNKIFDRSHAADNDDVEVWSAPIDYSSELRYRINQALDEYHKATKKFPGDEVTFRSALQRAGVDFNSLRNPLGHQYYVICNKRSLYTSRAEFVTVTKAGGSPQQQTEIIPITQTLITIKVRGVGEDDKEGTHDDFEVASFSRVIAEQSSQEAKSATKTELATSPATNQKIVIAVSPSSVAGVLAGVVLDASGAVIPNAVVKATNKTSLSVYEARTNEEGVYVLKNLPPGLYDVRFDVQGFKSAITMDVRVTVSKIVQFNMTMEVGGVSETVTVTGETMSVQTESASVSKVISQQISNLPLNGRNAMNLMAINPGAVQKGEIATPRLREYFPETLLWQPNLETDKQGRAQLKFKLADNITTWKLSLIGSTADGQIGTMEKEIRAFQPFFAELDPPKVLTEGDEIALPVVLRNYLAKAQTVDLQFKPESWFTLLSPARKQSLVQPNDTAQETFDFRAIASIKDGRQRVTAIGSTASDAIEKAVSVHPDGEELANTVANVFGAAGALDIGVPEAAIKGSVQAELKIYPNLLTHVTEGIEGILKRPYGCGEQTISSTYPNVMALRLLKSTGQDEAPQTAAMVAKARKFTQAGYERLLGYRDASGGFAYWIKGGADLALTAYALRFLHDAGEVIEVNADVLADARRWLLKQQYADGRWVVRDYTDKEDERRNAMYTALIARSLTAGGSLTKEERQALQKAFTWLAPKLAELAEPYTLANYALAAQQAGEQERAQWAVAKLRTLPQEEAGGLYWALETNTPFYGWGLTGRIETTALAIKALNGDATTRRESAALLGKAVFWLLKNKDRYGVWLSTQATITVLDAFVALSGTTTPSSAGTAEILLNGRLVQTITLPPSQQLSNPLVVNLTGQLTSGNNRIEIKRPAGAGLASAQLVETYYLPWAKSLATQSENFKPGQSRALRLAVKYDKPEAKIGENITCTVEAERIGFAGYGMLLAEIGLPPGAEVERASLQLAVKNAGYDINHYDVLPDRVIFYLWPRAGGVKFAFKFKLRYGVKAMTTASILYDYYNPEARAVVAPTRFVIR